MIASNTACSVARRCLRHPERRWLGVSSSRSDGGGVGTASVPSSRRRKRPGSRDATTPKTTTRDALLASSSSVLRRGGGTRRPSDRRIAGGRRRASPASAARTHEEISLDSTAVDDLPRQVEAGIQSFRDSLRDYASSLLSPTHERARRTGPVMDAKWWFWNLVLALSPATFITLYCQSVKPEMEEYYRNQREREKQRVIGHEDNADGVVGGVSLAGATAVDYHDSYVTDRGESPVQKVTMAVRDLLELPPGPFSSRGTTPNVETPTTPVAAREDVGVAESTTGEADAPGQSARVAIAPTGVSILQNGGAVRRDGAGREDSAPPLSENAGTEKETTMDDVLSAATMPELLRRIERLERRLASSEDERENRRLEKKRNHQLERTGQSGVRNRIDDKLIERWRVEDEAADRQRRNRSPHSNAMGEDEKGTKPGNTNSNSLAGAVLWAVDGVEEQVSAAAQHGKEAAAKAWSYFFRVDRSGEEDAKDASSSTDPSIAVLEREIAGATEAAAKASSSTGDSGDRPAVAIVAAVDSAVADVEEDLLDATLVAADATREVHTKENHPAGASGKRKDVSDDVTSELRSAINAEEAALAAAAAAAAAARATKSISSPGGSNDAGPVVAAAMEASNATRSSAALAAKAASEIACATDSTASSPPPSDGTLVHIGKWIGRLFRRRRTEGSGIGETDDPNSTGEGS